MLYLTTAVILAVCACITLLYPQSLNVLSEEQKRRMDRRKVGRIAFVGLMVPAVILFALYLGGVKHELVPMFIVIPFAIGTAAVIQINVK